MLKAVQALGALVDPTRAASTGSQVRDELLGVATLALRQLGFADGYIAREFGYTPHTIKKCARGVDVWMDSSTAAAHRQVLEQWNRTRRNASAWYQLDEVASCEVVSRHNIETPDWPLRVEALDLPAAEFLHQRSRERIIVYSLQRWKGTPHRTPGRPSNGT
jgi:hypothetical protein